MFIKHKTYLQMEILNNNFREYFLKMCNTDFLIPLKFLVQRSYLILENFSSLIFNSKWLIQVNSGSSLGKDSHRAPLASYFQCLADLTVR